MNESKRPSYWSWALSDPGTERFQRAGRRLLVTMFVWGVCQSGSSYLIQHGFLPAAGPIPWVVAALPSVVAVFLLVGYSRMLREADELHRLIQLRALALGFGGGYFVISGYLLLEAAGAPTLRVDVLIAVLPLPYAVGIGLGSRRYR